MKASAPIQPPRWLLDQPFAHRGLHDAHRVENSLAAVEAAVERGFGVEVDLRLSADRVPVVFHDKDLARLCGLSLPLSALTADSLSTQSLGGTAHSIPRLSELLTLVSGRVPLLLEIKNETRPGPLEEEVARLLKSYPGPVALQSFNPLSLRRLKALCPERPRGLLSQHFQSEEVSLDPLRRWLLRHLLLAPLCDPTFVAYCLEDISRPPLGLARLRRAGCPLLLWTIRDPEGRERASLLGDNYIFEGRGTPAPNSEPPSHDDVGLLE